MFLVWKVCFALPQSNIPAKNMQVHSVSFASNAFTHSTSERLLGCLARSNDILADTSWDFETQSTIWLGNWLVTKDLEKVRDVRVLDVFRNGHDSSCILCDSKRAFVRAIKDWQGCAFVAVRAHNMYSADLSGMCADSAFVSLHHCCPDLVCGWRFSWRNKLGIGHVYNQYQSMRNEIQMCHAL
jgi:hypothetical protein